MSVNKRQADGTLLPIAGLGSYDLNNLKQYATLPTPTSANEGQVVQYIGNDPDYFVGGMYQCQEDSGSYSWVLLSQNIVVDAELSTTSENPVQNKVINTALADKVDTSDLGTAAYKDVPESGDASTTEVVMGNDSRLTDSRNAKDVSAWAKASTKPTYTASEVGAIATTAKGSASGVAELDSTGKVPISQLPATMSRLEKYANRAAFPATGDDNTLYVALDTNYTYRWTGTDYVQIDESIQLGETASTAYRGDRGKIAYDHSQTTSGNPHNVTKSDVGLGNVGNFKAVSTVASQGLSDTEKSNARTNIGAGTSSLALGETSSTAYRGDRGKTAYTHATDSGRLTTATTSGLYKIGVTSEGHVSSATAVAKADITALGIPAQDTTYTPEKLGIGYGTCTTAAATASKAVTLANYNLVKNGVISVKFTNAVPASATLNVNSKGAKNIFYKGAAIVANVIRAGDVATFMYDGTQYHLLGVDRGAIGEVVFRGTTSAWNALSSTVKAMYTIVIITDD